MEAQVRITPEVKFCLQYLKDNHISTGAAFERCLGAVKGAPEYRLVPVLPKTFFTELATQMRELWPTGKKDGKWDWRAPVKELASRLEWLWTERDLKAYTQEDCLLVCRKYLNANTGSKYMKLLKYFILKQRDTAIGTDRKTGRIKYSYESEFANMLETLTDEERIAEQQAKEIEELSIDYGGELL